MNLHVRLTLCSHAQFSMFNCGSVKRLYDDVRDVLRSLLEEICYVTLEPDLLPVQEHEASSSSCEDGARLILLLGGFGCGDYLFFDL